MPGTPMTPRERQQDYMRMLRRPFTKLCRLRFLNPNGTTAFALDNNPRNKRSKAFIAEGSVTANWQNGQRLTAAVTLANADHAFSLAFSNIWFGQRVALDEGLILSNGEEYYRQTGVFVIDNPTEKIDPATRTVTYNLVDKWADLDGTLDGNLPETHVVDVGTNIFSPIAALLAEDRGNGQPVDNLAPVFTEYYNDKYEFLPDGTVASMDFSPYTLTVEGDGATVAGVASGLAEMVNAWIGYDNTGRLRVDPSQDDISDADKPVLWRFSTEEAQLLGLAYTVKKEDVYNDYVIVGDQLDDYAQPAGRATNNDPSSDTCVQVIGRKTKRESASGYATAQQCEDLAVWKLKRSGVLQKAVTVSCPQMMHIDLNSLVEIRRTDKPGNPVERHLVQGYTRPLAWNGEMTISATSVQDFPQATVENNGAGYSRFRFEFAAGTTETLYLTQSAPNAVTIDWGDGSACETVPDTAAAVSHTFSSGGSFVRIGCEGGKTWSPGATVGGNGYGFLGLSSTKGGPYPELKEVICGQGMRLAVTYGFSRCTGLTSFVIPPQATTTSSYVFYGCTGLTSVTISPGVTTLGTYLFFGCTGLTEMYVPKTVTSISSNPWTGCTNLTAVTVDPNSASFCDVDGVVYNKAKTSIVCYPAGLTGAFTMEATVKTIATGAFRTCDGLTSVTLSPVLTTVGSYGFYGCTALTSVTLPATVTSIGTYAFQNCTHMVSINIPTGVASIGTSTFSGCSALTSIVVPDTVTTLGNSAFYNCTGLTSADIGSGVGTFGTNVFYKNTSMTSLTVRAATPPTLSSNSITGLKAGCAIYVPSASVDAYKAAQYWIARASYIQAIPE